LETIEEIHDIQLENKRIGSNFLGILNDLKRRPEDAARELGVTISEINSIIDGKKELSHDLVNQAIKVWPVNKRDFYIIRDDCPTGVKIMLADESEKSRRIMERAGKPYYEYRDTVMSTIAPFRPEWIMELCYVDDNDPYNKDAQWNNGHFMHQFTYFIGEVNFYYKASNGEKKVVIMNTGDSMYITPFVPHTFATRKGAKQNGLILALTYGNKITGEVQQELSSISTNLGKEFALNFSTKNNSTSSLFKFHREIANLTIKELSERTNLIKDRIEELENGNVYSSESEIKSIADALHINSRDLLSFDKIEDSVVIKKHDDGKKWKYPELTKAYEFLELAFSTTLPYSKAFEVVVQTNENNSTLDLKVGLHQYVYNISNNNIELNWTLNDKHYQKILHPNDSAYIKPFLEHNFRGNGKLLVLRIGGKITGDSQMELSIIGKHNVERAVNETMQWFETTGKN